MSYRDTTQTSLEEVSRYMLEADDCQQQLLQQQQGLN
jgi:hypothetical protein